MSRFVRHSKVRHVYGEAAKTEKQYHGLRTSSATGDQNYVKANDKYFAFAVTTGGGALTAQPLSACGKLSPCLPVFDGHVGAVLDFDFDPFHSDILASGGDDCTTKLWQIPEGGLTDNIMEPLVNMVGHQKKVTVVRFHPTANGVLATGSADCTVKVWDATRGECKATCSAPTQLVQDVVWSYDGSQLAVTSKDKQMHLVDPRSGAATQSVQAHDGTKTSKLCFLGDSGRLCSVGFTRTSKRQFKIWDARMLSEGPVATCDIDQASGALMPFFDADTGVLYIAGKGDGNIRFYEITDQAPFQYHIGEYRGGRPTKGVAMAPKRSCDTSRCEVARLFKLTKDAVEPLSFIAPRKSDIFQADLFPDAYAGEPSLTADQFFAGQDAKPLLASMDPAKRALPHEDPAATAAAPAATSFVVQKSAAQLEQELQQVKTYVKLLQGRLEEHNIDYPSSTSAMSA